MSVYIDGLSHWGWRLGPSCHLIADTEDEMHAFAARIGLRRSWFQDKTNCHHYDLTEKRRAAAVKAGAVECNRAEFVCHMRRIRQARSLSAPTPRGVSRRSLMPCSECATRQRLLAEAEATLRDKQFKYRCHPEPRLSRLLGSYEHAVAQARENVENHRAEHERESR